MSEIGQYESAVVQAAREYRDASAACEAAEEEQRAAERKVTEANLFAHAARHRMRHAQAHLLIAASGNSQRCGFNDCELR